MSTGIEEFRHDLYHDNNTQESGQIYEAMLVSVEKWVHVLLYFRIIVIHLCQCDWVTKIFTNFDLSVVTNVIYKQTMWQKRNVSSHRLKTMWIDYL